MKITAKVVPYSSVVGSSITLHAESGMTICQLSLLSVIPPNFTFTPELHKQTSTRIAEWVACALNGAAEFDAAPALENSKAPLADAHSKSLSSDLSSLRKGAEELRRKLAGYAITEEYDFPGDAPEFCGFWCNECKEHVEADGSGHRDSCLCHGVRPQTARAALVSGSREDGADA